MGHNIICDFFRASILENRTILVMADGCGWGRKSRNAAELVSKVYFIASYITHSSTQTVMDFLMAPDTQKNIQTTVDCLHEILSSFRQGHDAILKSCEYIDECGTSTLLSGMIMKVYLFYILLLILNQLRPNIFAGEEWAFIAVSVGDCKAFHWDPVKKKVTDVTFGNRTNVRDARDCGGRLGPYVGVSDPDLRNLASFHCPCKPGDMIFVCTDGVHDNFDPEALGLNPDELVCIPLRPFSPNVRERDISTKIGIVCLMTKRRRLRQHLPSPRFRYCKLPLFYIPDLQI